MQDIISCDVNRSLFARTEDSVTFIVTQALTILSLPSDRDGLMSTEGDVQARNNTHEPFYWSP
jgi:hypothetical protein